MTQNNLPVIGITGGVGSGKSVVMEILSEEFGGAVILADQVGHDLMQPGAVSYRQIISHFGQDILDEDGQINRQALAAIVFSDEAKLKELNGITHPNIRREIIERIKGFRTGGGHPFIALEAALLIEGGYEEITDELWYIYVTEENRIKRLMAARGYSEEKCRAIISSQLSDAVFRQHCRTIIDNNGSVEETRRSVAAALLKSGIIKEYTEDEKA